MKKPCPACGLDDWGSWTSTRTAKRHWYCRECRRRRARAYAARKASNGGRHSRTEWLAKLRSFLRCPACRRRWPDIPPRPNRRYSEVRTKDHIVPLMLGGRDDISNLQPLCYQCNFSKGGRPEADRIEKMTGRLLNRMWNVEAKQGLYHLHGTWYHHLVRFPGVLWDQKGYVRFSDRKAYQTARGLKHSEHLHVRAGISQLPGYTPLSGRKRLKPKQ